MPLNATQWQKALAADSLRPVYLLVGEELLVLEAADALRAQARKLGYSERDVLDAGTHFDWNDLARAGAGMSLFATRRMIDLRLPTGRPGKEGAAALTEFCADPPPDVTLLVTATTWSNKHDGAWSKKLDATGAMVVFNAPRPNEWGSWIGARLASRSLSATPDAAALLAERVEGNLLAAAQEVDKLAVLRAGDSSRIDAAAMESLVADSARYDAFKLTDAAFVGDGARDVFTTTRSPGCRRSGRSRKTLCCSRSGRTTSNRTPSRGRPRSSAGPMASAPSGRVKRTARAGALIGRPLRAGAGPTPGSARCSADGRSGPGARAPPTRAGAGR